MSTTPEEQYEYDAEVEDGYSDETMLFDILTDKIVENGVFKTTIADSEKGPKRVYVLGEFILYDELDNEVVLESSGEQVQDAYPESPESGSTSSESALAGSITTADHEDLENLEEEFDEEYDTYEGVSSEGFIPAAISFEALGFDFFIDPNDNITYLTLEENGAIKNAFDVVSDEFLNDLVLLLQARMRIMDKYEM